MNEEPLIFTFDDPEARFPIRWVEDLKHSTDDGDWEFGPREHWINPDNTHVARVVACPTDIDDDDLEAFGAVVLIDQATMQRKLLTTTDPFELSGFSYRNGIIHYRRDAWRLAMTDPQTGENLRGPTALFAESLDNGWPMGQVSVSAEVEREGLEDVLSAAYRCVLEREGVWRDPHGPMFLCRVDGCLVRVSGNWRGPWRDELRYVLHRLRRATDGDLAEFDFGPKIGKGYPKSWYPASEGGPRHEIGPFGAIVGTIRNHNDEPWLEIAGERRAPLRLVSSFVFPNDTDAEGSTVLLPGPLDLPHTDLDGDRPETSL